MVKIGLGVTAGCDVLAPARCAPSLAVSRELALAGCGVSVMAQRRVMAPDKTVA